MITRTGDTSKFREINTGCSWSREKHESRGDGCQPHMGAGTAKRRAWSLRTSGSVPGPTAHPSTAHSQCISGTFRAHLKLPLARWKVTAFSRGRCRCIWGCRRNLEANNENGSPLIYELDIQHSTAAIYSGVEPNYGSGTFNPNLATPIFRHTCAKSRHLRHTHL